MTFDTLSEVFLEPLSLLAFSSLSPEFISNSTHVFRVFMVTCNMCLWHASFITPCRLQCVTLFLLVSTSESNEAHLIQRWTESGGGGDPSTSRLPRKLWRFPSANVGSRLVKTLTVFLSVCFHPRHTPTPIYTSPYPYSTLIHYRLSIHRPYTYNARNSTVVSYPPFGGGGNHLTFVNDADDCDGKINMSLWLAAADRRAKRKIVFPSPYSWQQFILGAENEVVSVGYFVSKHFGELQMFIMLSDKTFSMISEDIRFDQFHEINFLKHSGSSVCHPL
jgi:hypothetical protein